MISSRALVPRPVLFFLGIRRNWLMAAFVVAAFVGIPEPMPATPVTVSTLQEPSQTTSTPSPPSENLPEWKHYLTPGPNLQPPQAVTSPEPPSDASSQNAQHKTYHARARLRLGIDGQGKVEKVEVVKKVGFGLDEKAVETVKTWKFKPATLNGRPVPSQVYVDISFNLNRPPIKQ